LFFTIKDRRPTDTKPLSKPLFQAMSQQPPHPSDSHSLSSGYPPPQRINYPLDEYKISYDDLVDEHATPYGRIAQHQAFAVESPALGSPLQHHQGSSMPPLQQKQSYSSEYDGKYTEEDLRPQAPRILPIKGEKEVDTRTVWQKVSLRSSHLCTPSVVDNQQPPQRFYQNQWLVDYMSLPFLFRLR
jgi:hypothetical protein